MRLLCLNRICRRLPIPHLHYRRISEGFPRVGSFALLDNVDGAVKMITLNRQGNSA